MTVTPMPAELIPERDGRNRKRKRTPSPSNSSAHAEVPGDMPAPSKLRKLHSLRVEIPVSLSSGLEQENDSEGEGQDSLFSDSDVDSFFDDASQWELDPGVHTDDDFLALRTVPPIPGLYFQPNLVLPQDLAEEVVSFCMKTYFRTPADNQVMLFGRFIPSTESAIESSSGFPRILHELLDKVSCILKPAVPSKTYDLLFPTNSTKARQAIINLYQPGEGITPHVDLLGRYADGIVGVSFSNGCSMRFDKVNPVEDDSKTRWDVYLPENSIIVLSEEARYDWTHGIDKKRKDYVSTETPGSNTPGSWIERSVRMSVTFRWLLPGADIVGDGS
ncbi:hypothetical protein CPC08DRAFT_673422 [Agrocybe pediades]|nr:hypothetical protein CPC08DRAFT_673422 [Agrocybe pediades]